MDQPQNSFFPLAEFLVYLRNEDFPVGVDTYMRVQKVLDYMPAELSSTQLQQILCPIFARSEAEQRRFYRLYDAYFSQREEALFAAARKDLTTETVAAPPTRLDWSWIRKYSRMTFIILTLLITCTFVYLPLRVYWAIKGTDNIESAPDYLDRYGFGDSDRYNFEVAKYVIRDLLFIDQPCNDLAQAGFSYVLLPADTAKGTFPVQFQSYPAAEEGGTSLSWTFPNGTALAQVNDPIYAFPDTGVYYVALSFQNAYGCRTDLKRSVEVMPEQICEARFSYVISPEDPLSVQFSDTSLTEVDDEVTSRIWEVTGQDSLSQASVNPTIRFPDFGTYQVCLKITTQKWCVNQSCEQIVLEDPNPQVALVPIRPKQFVAIQRPEKRSPYLIFILLGGAILVLVGGFFHDVYRRLKRRVALQRERNSEGPFYNELTLDFETPLYPEEQLFGAARMLRQRQERATSDLDLPQTITATLESGGFPSFRYQVGSRASEYLVLIERRSRRDHWAALQDHLLKTIGTLDVFVDRYYYDQEFANFYRVQDVKPLSLGELKQRHPEHRLIIMGDGEGLTDILTGNLSFEVLDLLGWEDRGLLTSASPQDWSLQEVSLARYFRVLPATLTSLTQLPELWSDQRQYRLTRIPDGLLVPVPDSTDAELIPILKGYLGPYGFKWLAACALYPELHWDLTRYLGQVLAEMEPEGAYLEEATWLRLVRLPYFRSGTLSDSLRLTLANTVEPALKKEIRAAIVFVLEQNEPEHACYAHEQHEIRLKTQQWEAGVAGAGVDRRELGEEVSEMLMREEIDDVVLLDELSHVRAGKFEMSWSEGLRNLIFDQGMPMLGVKTWLRLSLALLLALLMLSPLLQRSLSPEKSRSFSDWIRRPGNLVRIDGSFVRLTDHLDSARYASYLGEDLYNQGDFGSAFNRFSQAIQLAPTQPVFYYQRGLAGLRLSRSRHLDNDIQGSYDDFARAQNLIPTLTSESLVLPETRYTARQPDLQFAALSQDGAWVLNCRSNLVQLQQVTGGSLIAKWSFREEERVRRAALSPSKEFVAVVLGEEVAVFDVRSGQELYRLQEHTRPINVCRFSHDGSKILTAGEDNLTLIWDRATGVLDQALEFIHTDAILDANFSPDDKFIVTASADSTVGIWQVKDGLFLREMIGHDAPVISAHFMGRGGWFLTAAADGEVILWNEISRSLNRYKIPAQRLYGVSLTDDGSEAGIVYQPKESDEVIFEIIATATGQSIRKIPVQGLLALKKGSETQPPSLSISLTLNTLLINLPGQGWESMALAPALNTSGLKPFSIFNAGVMQYEAYKFVWTERSMTRYIQMRPDDPQAYLGLGLAQLYQVPAAVSPISRTRLSQSALNNLEKALIADSTGETQLTRILPVILDQYNQFAELKNIKTSYCRVLDLFEEGTCDQFLTRYAQIMPYVEGRAAVENEGLWGYIDTLGTEVIPIQYAQASSFMKGLAQVRTKEGSPIQFIDQDGAVVFSSSKTEAESLIPVQDAESDLWGFISARDYRLVIPPTYDLVWAFGRGYAKVEQDGDYYLIDNQGRTVYGPYMRLDGNFGQDSVIMAYRKGREMERISYISPDARQLERNRVDPVDSAYKPAPVPSPSSETSGPSIVLIGQVHDGLILARRDNRYGYVFDPNQNSYMQKTTPVEPKIEIAIEFQYSDGQDFRQGRAGVKVPNGNWGYIDTYGKAITRFQYESVKPFEVAQDGPRAKVNLNGREMYIDLNGNCVSTPELPCPMVQTKPMEQRSPSKGTGTRDSETGLVAFKQDGLFGLKNQQGETLVPAIYENPIAFQEGLAPVKRYGRWGFIDPTGKEVIQLVYEDVQGFSDGLAAIQLNGKWGYINKTGKVIILPRFLEANAFHQGKAVVREGKLSFRINRMGSRIGDRRK